MFEFFGDLFINHGPLFICLYPMLALLVYGSIHEKCE